MTIPLPAAARSELDAITGPGKTMKRGAYIAEAILEKLARGPAHSTNRDVTNRARGSK